MADRNIVQIRHGSEQTLLDNPTVLEDYELGFTSDKGILYIRASGALIPIGSFLASSMFGTSDPPITGAREGQVYFKLIEE